MVRGPKQLSYLFLCAHDTEVEVNPKLTHHALLWPDLLSLCAVDCWEFVSSRPLQLPRCYLWSQCRYNLTMRDSIQNNVTFNGCMADVATTSMTWTFIGGGEKFLSQNVDSIFRSSLKSHNFCLAAMRHPAWGAFNPYPVGVDVAKVGRKLVLLPPFSSLASVGYYAGLFGSMTLVKCLTSGGLALARNRRDVWNDLFGVAAVYGYARFLFISEKRVYWNNRAFAGIAISSVIYANTVPWPIPGKLFFESDHRMCCLLVLSWTKLAHTPNPVVQRKRNALWDL